MGQAEQIFTGMDVYDADNHKVGRVVGYDRALGYFQTEGTFSGARYIPFLAIESIGPTGAHLNVTRDVVTNVYHRMPGVKPDLTKEGKLTGGGTVPSGYDRTPVPLDADAIRVVREKIQVGTSVFDEDGLKLGDVEAYDGETGYMRVEKGSLAPKEIFLPVTTVTYLDDRGIHLSVTKEAIANRFSNPPDVAREVFGR